MYPSILEKLIEGLSRLPGVGRRSAERMALYILESSNEYANSLSELILNAKKAVRPCKICNNFSLNDICSICKDQSRDKSMVCIVEHPKDIISIERSGIFKGTYYVLLGGISPLDGRGPNDINLKSLENTLSQGIVKEVIIATDSDNEGQITAVFLKEKLAKYKVKLYRIGLGLPLGRQIEHTDSATIKESFLEKKNFV